MLAIFNVVFPVFALIFLGYLCRKRNILSVNAASELNRFVIYLGLPALLFDSIARLTPADFSNLRFIAVFAIGIAAVFLLTVWIKYRQGAAAADIIVDSLGTSYANVGFIGIPLCLLAFGRDGMPPAVIAMVMTAGGMPSRPKASRQRGMPMKPTLAYEVPRLSTMMSAAAAPWRYLIHTVSRNTAAMPMANTAMKRRLLKSAGVRRAIESNSSAGRPR